MEGFFGLVGKKWLEVGSGVVEWIPCWSGRSTTWMFQVEVAWLAMLVWPPDQVIP